MFGLLVLALMTLSCTHPLVLRGDIDSNTDDVQQLRARVARLEQYNERLRNYIIELTKDLRARIRHVEAPPGVSPKPLKPPGMSTEP